MKRTALLCALALTVAAACTSSDGDGDRPDSTSPGTGQASPVAVHTAPEPKGGWFDAACDMPPKQLKIIARGYDEERSPDLTIVPREPNFFGSFTNNSHSGPWDYAQRVPIIFYGPGYIKAQGEINPKRRVTSADMAPTIADLLDYPWPEDRPSVSLADALVPASERPDPPKLVMTVVWDGSGRNVLEQWPRAWPNLRSIVKGGTSFGNAIVGSSPSVTPAVHATMGTGTFPDQHRIVDIPLRVDGKIVGSWSQTKPSYLATETLSDLYDRDNGNEPLVGMVGDHGWHLGMIGHGSYLKGGDKDFGVLFNGKQEPKTNPDYYKLPSYVLELEGIEADIPEIDESDGEADGRWMGNDVLEDPKLARLTPAATLYQTRILRELMTREGFGQDDIPDLLYTNYKQIDYAGHRFNMLDPEMREAVHYSDQELGELKDYLNESVGKGEWVMVITADHGSTPAALATNAWPIGTQEILDDLSEHFDLPIKTMVQNTRVTGFWLNRDGLAANDVSPEDVAEFILDMRIEDNAVAVEQLPEGYSERLDEHIFSAVFPSGEMDAILECAGVEL